MYRGMGYTRSDYSWCGTGNAFIDFFCGADSTLTKPGPPLPMPPVVGVPDGGYSTGPGGTVNANPTETANEILDRQWREWMAANQAAMGAAAAGVDAEKPATDWTPVVLLVGAVALLSFLKG